MHLLLLTLLFGASTADFVPFPYMGEDIVDADNSFGNTTAISAACAEALNTTIACESQLQYMQGSFTPWRNNQAAAQFCSSKCRSSLESYSSSVQAQCGTADIFNGLPSSWRGDQIRDYLNVMCLTESSSGKYCVEVREDQINANAGKALLDMPDSVVCSECNIGVFRAIQASSYNGYNNETAEAWASIQQKCGKSFPTNVTIADLTPRTVGSNETAECESGRKYTVKAEDTCKSIALAQSVSQGALWTINNLQPDCSRLNTGDELCLPRSCSVIDMSKEANATCFITALSHNATYAAFISWNPSINSDCSNLSPNDSIVCVSSPYDAWNQTALAGVSPTKTVEWATSTAPAPAPTAHGTTKFCGLWYVCLPGDDCARISIQYNISPDLFKALNPSVDSDCTNLTPKLAYCVQPEIEWNGDVDAAPNSTVISAPAPTTTGTTNQCYAWYVPVDDDSCTLVAESFGISLSTLRYWNPSIDENCYNFLTGVAYCVAGPESPSDTTITSTAATTRRTSSTTSARITSSSTSTKAAPSSTSAGSSTCSKTYTVVSGDYCYKIYTDNGLTEAQFLALNPKLNSDCDLDVGQTVCVGGQGTATTQVPASSTQPTIKSTTTFQSTTTAKSSTSTRSTSTAASTCGKTYTVASGDYCYKIYTDNGLTEAQFRALNPQLNTNCDLDVGQTLCVGGQGAATTQAPTSSTKTTTTAKSTSTAAAACKKSYTVISGDTCYKVWSANGLTEAQFRGLNPQLNANCDLNLGQVLCVA